MAKNENLNAAKATKNDEFYTRLEDINAEMIHYEEHFKDKIIFMNCDDPEWSNFWRYFHLEFERLGLKKIISTHYESGEVQTYKLEYEGGDDMNFEAGTKTPLKQNGDFRSPECVELLKEADIVITNPPFSIAREEFVPLLFEHKKDFLIIGDLNWITYKNIFPLLKDNKMWLGYNSVKKFKEPDGSYRSFGNKTWFTNLDIKKRHEEIETTYLYSKKDELYPELYPKYVNYDAIEISNISTIPMDYEGVMGVPITFLCKHNPQQYIIVGNSLELCEKMSKIANKGEYMQGGVRPYIELKNGPYKYKRLYDRLFIKKIKKESD